MPKTNKKGFFFLRKIHGEIHERSVKLKQSVLLKRFLKSDVYIFGTPTHTNLGDSAIVLAQRWFLEQCGIAKESIKEITMPDYDANEALIKKYASSRALIAQLGGGNMGSQWLNEEYLHRRLLTNHPHNPEIIFPQTIHYLDDEQGKREAESSIAIYNNRENLVMIAREQVSYDAMKRLYPNTKVLLTPDIVLSTNKDMFGVKSADRSKVMLCFRSDAEKAMTEEQQCMIKSYLSNHDMDYYETDMHSMNDVTEESRLKQVREKMQEFANAKLVITDRLHGMIFAAVTETPCVVFGNYNHKVKGTYKWIDYLPYIYYVESTEEAVRAIPQLFKMDGCVFDNTPLQPYYDQIKEVVKNYV